MTLSHTRRIAALEHRRDDRRLESECINRLVMRQLARITGHPAVVQLPLSHLTDWQFNALVEERFPDLLCRKRRDYSNIEERTGETAEQVEENIAGMLRGWVECNPMGGE